MPPSSVCELSQCFLQSLKTTFVCQLRSGLDLRMSRIFLDALLFICFDRASNYIDTVWSPIFSLLNTVNASHISREESHYSICGAELGFLCTLAEPCAVNRNLLSAIVKSAGRKAYLTIDHTEIVGMVLYASVENFIIANQVVLPLLGVKPAPQPLELVADHWAVSHLGCNVRPPNLKEIRAIT